MAGIDLKSLYQLADLFSKLPGNMANVYAGTRSPRVGVGGFLDNTLREIVGMGAGMMPHDPRLTPSGGTAMMPGMPGEPRAMGDRGLGPSAVFRMAQEGSLPVRGEEPKPPKYVPDKFQQAFMKDVPRNPIAEDIEKLAKKYGIDLPPMEPVVPVKPPKPPKPPTTSSPGPDEPSNPTPLQDAFRRVQWQNMTPEETIQMMHENIPAYFRNFHQMGIEGTKHPIDVNDAYMNYLIDRASVTNPNAEPHTPLELDWIHGYKLAHAEKGISPEIQRFQDIIDNAPEHVRATAKKLGLNPPVIPDHLRAKSLQGDALIKYLTKKQ